MDREKLIDEICKRVLQLLAERDSGIKVEYNMGSVTANVVKSSDACKKELVLDKKAITERDVITARENGVHRVLVKRKAILTDLAKEYAHRYQIEIVREHSSDMRRQGG